MTRKKILDLFLKHRSVCTDTRQIVKDALFFSLKGANFNGNSYAQKAIEAGCSVAIVDEEEYHTENTILVKDALESLQELAMDFRDTLSIPILSISGSNGKTTTKEIIRDVLLKKFSVFATHGNLNNHIGVPLSLLSIPEDTEIAIIEMGANHQKEIEFLCTIAKPNFGLLTNIGKAHLEGFGGLEGVRKGKGELFDFIRKTNGYLFINTDLDYLEAMAKGIQQTKYCTEGGKFQIQLKQTTPTINFEWSFEGETSLVKTNFTGIYNLHNMSAAIAIGTHFGVDTNDISEAISSYKPENNRSQLLKTENNTLILDAYNANPTSIEHALDNLYEMNSSSKFFILGDMLELGEYSTKEHRRIIDLAKSLKLTGIYVGPTFRSILGPGNNTFENTEEAMSYLKDLHLNNTTILIKGSRGIKLEVLTKVL